MTRSARFAGRILSNSTLNPQFGAKYRRVTGDEPMRSADWRPIAVFNNAENADLTSQGASEMQAYPGLARARQRR